MKKIFTLISALTLSVLSYGQVVNTYPYSENFEGEGLGAGSCGVPYTMLSLGWSNDLTDNMDWEAKTGTTGSGSTGPTVNFGADHNPGNSTGHYLYTETSSGCGNGFNVANLESPWFNFISLTTPKLSFWYNMYGSSMGTMHLDIRVGLSAPWTMDVIPAWTDNLDLWQEVSYNMGAYTTNDSVQIRIRSIAGSSFRGDMALDDFSITEAPSCSAPTALAVTNIAGDSATLSWSENGSAAAWDIEWGATGFMQSTGTMISNTTLKPYKLTGLSAQTSYEFYVRSICGVADTSLWSGPFNFITPCAIAVAPFTENFNSSFVPPCWAESGSEAWKYSTGAGFGAAAAGDHTGNIGSNYAWIDGSTPSGATEISTLTSPLIDVSGLTVPCLYYWVFSNNTNDSGNNTLTVEFYDGLNWNTVQTLQANNQGWTQYFVNLSSYNITGAVQVSFTIAENSAFSPFYNDILIDDISIKQAPSIDLAVTSVIPPATVCNLTNAEDITITVLNAGLNDTANFNLSYQINGGVVVTEIITTTVMADSTFTYTFNTQADFSAATTYNVATWVSLINDNNQTNDTTWINITNNAPTVNLGNDTTICSGVNLTLDATSLFASYIWSDNSTNATLTVNSANTYAVTLTDNANCSVTDSIVVSTISFTPPNLGADTSACMGNPITVDAGTYSTYLWSDGSTTQTLTASTGGLYSVTVVDANTSCTASSVININIITPTSNFTMPVTFCEADMPMLLNVTPTGGTFSGNGIIGNTFNPTIATPGNYDVVYNYSVSSIPPYTIDQTGTFAPIIGSGTLIDNLGDDDITSALPVGFTFNFFGNNYTDFYISSNGFISFQDNGSGCCSGQQIPDAGTPNNLIAYSWTDMNPTDGGNYDYFTTGVAPNRILVINVNNVSFYDNTGGVPSATTQILLYEGTNVIEIHSTDIQDNTAGGKGTMGIENVDGTAGYAVPGRNRSYWTAANDFVQFTPGTMITCYNSDTVNVDVFANPVVDLGIDTTICDPSIYSLDAGNIGSTYLWSNASTAQTLAVDTTGYYNVLVTNTSSCAASDTIYILDIAAPVVNLGNDTTLCYLSTLTLDALMPTATYVWSTGETSSSINVSVTGQYIVSVTKCATVVDTINVTINPEVTKPTLGADYLVCWNDSVVLDGGVYNNYAWTNGDTNQINTIFSSCNYKLEMYDDYGDGWNGNTFDFYENNTIIGSATAPDMGITTGSGPHYAYFNVNTGAALSINHDNSGSYQGEVSYYLYDGFGNLVYSVATGSYSATATNVWTGIATCPSSKNVSLVVSDTLGCSNSDTVNIVFSTPVLDLGTDTSVCVGDMITVDAGIHTSYLWSDGSTNQTLDLTTAGTYFVTVTDSIGCTKIDSIVFGINQFPVVNLGADTAICLGTTLNLDGGILMSNYNWSNGTSNQINAITMAGNYAVTVTDLNGCAGSDSIIVSTISVMASTSVTDATCGSSNGSVVVSATAGMSPYTFAWSNGNTTTTTSGNTAGIYTVTVTDSYGCSSSNSANIANSNGPQIVSTTVTNNLCNGTSNGAIDITTTGGLTPYTYIWNTSATSMNVSGLVAGTYNVTVSDNNNCMGYNAIVLIDPMVLTTDTATSPILCNGASNGSISAFVTGGTTPYSYLWTNSSTDMTTTGVSTGNYGYTVTDANNCVANMSVSLSEPSAIILTTSILDVSCNGLNDGAITVMASGGTPSYSYAWDNGETTMSIVGVTGNYTVTVTDNNGCVNTIAATVSEPNILTATVSTTDATCGNNDGSASIAVTGGTLAYSYGWNNGVNTSASSNLAFGNYVISITDGKGCSLIESFTINNSNGPTVVANIGNPSCNGNSDGSILANGNGGTSPYSYLWDNGTTSSLNSGLAAGTYHVSVMDNSGCASVDVITLTEPVAVSVSTTVTDETISGTNNGTATAIGTGGTGVFTYSWSNGNSTDMISGLAPNTYTVTASDANGCSASTTVSVAASTITCNLVVNLGNDTIFCDVNTLTLDAGAGFSSYVWSTNETTQTVSVSVTGTYSVTVSDINNCTAVDTIIATSVTCLGVEQLTSTWGVSVYPNPTKGQFVINVSSFENTEATLSVYSIDGKLVYSNVIQIKNGLTSTEVDLTGIATGVYHVELTTSSHSSIEKLVID